MRVRFYQDWARDETCFSVSYIVGGQRFVAKPVELTFEEVGAGVWSEPAFRIKSPKGEELLRALMQGLIEYGIKVPENLELKGRLEAQAAHIRFLEELVKEHWSR